MAYPGVDWRRLTVAVFYGRISVIPHCKAIIDGTYTAEMNQKYKARTDRKQIFAKLKHSSLFPDVEI